MTPDSPALKSVNADGHVAEVDQLATRVAELERQLSDWRQFTERMGELPSVPGLHDRSFFPLLAETLAKTLSADYVMVGEFRPDEEIIRAPAIYAQGRILVGDEYRLSGTPCENVVGRRECVFTANVQGLFPQDRILADWGVESYVGMPLFDAKGTALGLLAAMWTASLTDAEPARSMLALFAGRAAREIERVRADEALRASEARFRTLCQLSPMGVFEADERGFCTYLSTQWEAITGRRNEQLLGFGWADFMHPDDIAHSRATCAGRVCSAVPIWMSSV